MSQVRYCDHSQRPNERRADAFEPGPGIRDGFLPSGSARAGPDGRAVEATVPAHRRAIVAGRRCAILGGA